MSAAHPLALPGSALRVSGLSKRFGATLALDDVSFEVAPGQVHGLLGGNGSGKSTLIKILAGVYHGDGGRFTLARQEVEAGAISPALARHCGIRFVHQIPAVFGQMSVADNMAIGHGYPGRGGHIDNAAQLRRTRQLLERFGIAARPEDEMATLRPADQTMVAIARALQDEDSGGVALLVLDEPTAWLPAHEVKVLLAAVRKLAQAGRTILYVSHRIDEILEITDALTVLRDGRHVVTRPTAGLSEAGLVEHIVGRPVARSGAGLRQSSVTAATGRPGLELRCLQGGPIAAVSLVVAPGEVVGIAGLLGSGRTELLQMIFGAQPSQAGAVLVGGQRVQVRSPADAMQHGIAYVAEDRARDAAFSELSVRENFSAAQVRKYWRRGWFQRRREVADTGAAVAEFGIKTAGCEAPLASLSGGNQQKVVMARWLRRAPQVLLLDEPTQGVDVGARADLYRAVRNAAARGTAVLLVSSDLEELAYAADRVLVLRNGGIAAEIKGDELTTHRLTEIVYTNEGST
ncbi:MAG: sugar ABC transporter ATP-binding protein [Pseudomonadota bacterium]